MWKRTCAPQLLAQEQVVTGCGLTPPTMARQNHHWNTVVFDSTPSSSSRQRRFLWRANELAYIDHGNGWFFPMVWFLYGVVDGFFLHGWVLLLISVYFTVRLFLETLSVKVFTSFDSFQQIQILFFMLFQC